MNKPTLTLDEIKNAADAAEAEAQEALQDRRAAIIRAAEAMKKASKARAKLVRALGNQGEGSGDG